jgi:hypothetical protein
MSHSPHYRSCVNVFGALLFSANTWKVSTIHLIDVEAKLQHNRTQIKVTLACSLHKTMMDVCVDLTLDNFNFSLYVRATQLKCWT